MIEKLLVDNVDIRSQYGVYVTEGGLVDLFSYPPLKEPTYTSWAERDGIDVDLASPKLDSKKVNISFATRGSVSYFLQGLFTYVPYHSFLFPDLGLQKTLRLVSTKDYQGDVLKLFTLEFADDYPLEGYSYLTPSSLMRDNSGLTIDGNDLSYYSIKMLSGEESIVKTPDVKENL